MAVDKGVFSVSERHSGRLSKKQQAELDDALAALIASTRRVARKLNLLEISEKLAIARKHLGSIGAVALAVDLSSEMLRQFARVETLSPAVKDLIRKGRLSSVDIADRISRLPLKDQGFVAESVAAGKLDSGDVRSILAHRRVICSGPIREVVRTLLRSKNVREYVIEFVLPEHVSRRAANRQLVSFFGKHEIRSIEIGDSTGQVCVSDEGRTSLVETARAEGLTKRRLIEVILSGGQPG